MITNGTVKYVNPESKEKEFLQPAGKRDLQQLHVDMFEPGRTTRMILMFTSSVLFFKQQLGIEIAEFRKRRFCFSNRITNSPDHRLAKQSFFRKEYRTHSREEATCFISATSFKTTASIETKLV
jgi:hypothetical protein